MNRAAWDKLIVALDSDNKRKIKGIVRSLRPKVKKFKLGLIPYSLEGSRLVKWVKQAGGEVFLDLKLYDIPNTMVETARIITDLGVWATTVHIKAGEEALRRVKAAMVVRAKEKKLPVPLLIGVSELTSDKASFAQVMRLVKIGVKSGIDGIVCGVGEAKRIKDFYGRLLVITPGIRNVAAGDDQKRIATVKEALKNKVDYFVVGRPITQASDYLKAARDLLR
ncbi:MAG: orotidine-5'-phosphate decarboxylase [Candidatus Omnitrophota bacterium]